MTSLGHLFELHFGAALTESETLGGGRRVLTCAQAWKAGLGFLRGSRHPADGPAHARSVGELTEEAQLTRGTAANGEEGPERLRGVDTQQAAARAPIDAQEHVAAGPQREAERVAAAWHGPGTRHYPVLLAVEQRVGVGWQLRGPEPTRVTRRDAEGQRAGCR